MVVPRSRHDERVGRKQRRSRFSQAMAGRTMVAVADAVGVSPSTVHGYSKGAMPAADIGLKVARHLGVDLNWWINGEGEASSALRALATSDRLMNQVPPSPSMTDDDRGAMSSIVIGLKTQLMEVESKLNGARAETAALEKQKALFEFVIEFFESGVATRTFR